MSEIEQLLMKYLKKWSQKNNQSTENYTRDDQTVLEYLNIKIKCLNVERKE